MNAPAPAAGLPWRARLADARALLERVLALPADADAEAVVTALDDVLEPLDAVEGRAHLEAAAHPDAARRADAEEAARALAAFRTDLGLHRGLYERLARLEGRELADPLLARYVERALRDLRREGVDRDEPTRARIRALQEELVELGQTFDRNIVAGARRVRLADGHAALAGLPDDFVAQRPEEADGALVLTTDSTDLLPVLAYAEREDVRRALWLAQGARAFPVLRALRERRHELARLLGHPTWAHHALEGRMVGDPAAARAFVERCERLARSRAREELAELLAEKRELDPAAERVEPWDRAFLVERVRARRFGHDALAVRACLPFAAVKEGVLRTTGEVFGIELVRVPDAAVWHPAVETYEVREAGRARGRFHLDLHPRPDKYKHAALFDLRAGQAGRELPEAALVCNFPEPRPGEPALLEHRQVVTLFHELGHLLHHLLGGGQRWRRFCGISDDLEWDFVEVPSQLYEEWAWDPRVLARFAHHHATGEPLSAERVERLRAAAEFGEGLQVCVQMGYADLSLSCFDRDPAEADAAELARAAHERSVPLPFVEGTHVETAFGHLNGYSAAYYTYMWSLVIAKDLASAFGGDLLDDAVARRYRERVLAPGGTRDAAQLVRDFLGRDYDARAFEAWLARRG